MAEDFEQGKFYKIFLEMMSIAVSRPLPNPPYIFKKSDRHAHYFDHFAGDGKEREVDIPREGISYQEYSEEELRILASTLIGRASWIEKTLKEQSQPKHASPSPNDDEAYHTEKTPITPGDGYRANY
jgi:hypothetical protein